MLEPSTKPVLRRQAQTARATLKDAVKRGRQALAHLRALPKYFSAGRVLHYVSARSELPTQQLIQAELAAAQHEVAVPWCRGEDLELFRLGAWEELTPGAFGILEPSADLRAMPDRAVDVHTLDIIIVPGVAFDRLGGRLGHGKGFYDRLLSRASEQTVLIGLCFDCQVVARVPREPHDVAMHWLITETGAIACNPGSLN